MKVIVDINNINNIEKYINKGVNAFFFGLKDFSIDYVELTLEEIELITNKYENIEFFMGINKNIFNSEIDTLKEYLIKLDKLNIKGILFYDLAVLKLKKDLNINTDLVWNQTHMITNYNTCDYYYKKNIKYGIISSELTIDEIIEINNNSDMKFMTLLYGHPIMSHSKRKLLTNYYKSNNKEYDNKTHIIKEHDKEYLIKENKNGTSIIYGNIINGSSCLKKLIDNNFEYAIIKEEYIEENLFNNLLDLVLDYINNADDNTLSKIDNLIGIDTNFFNKKTIYKVKKE